MHTLACIVVHYGDPALTADSVASLQSGSHIPRVIVVSNTDAAGTLVLHEALRAREFSLCSLAEGDQPLAQGVIAVLPLGSNKGFAVACNAGLRVAQQMPGVRYAWLLNNDATVAVDAAELLLACLAQHPRAVCGTSVLRADSPDVLELALGCCFSPLTTIITPCRAKALPKDVPDTPHVDYIYGASVAFPLTLVDEIGFLDEAFFLYYEEHDYCLRARTAGYAFHWCREAQIWHGFVSATAASAPSQSMRAFKHFHETRSTLLFMRKHHALPLLPAMLFRTAAKFFVLWRQRQLWLLGSYFRGIWAGLWRSGA